MCGIAGNLKFGSGPPVDARLLESVRDTMRKRGPDGAGLWCSADGQVGLAHRRLSIIDLSPGGQQPMATADGRLRIVFNGEIYNYPELRRELIAQGHQFRSTSDTEVLLHLYDRYELEMFRFLRGMYAFGLWDESKRRLLLARDPLGIKPLYLAQLRGELWFGSQVRALVAAGFPGAEDLFGLVGFDLWGHVPEPYTMFREIRQLPAGSYMVVDAGGKSTSKRFWSLSAYLASDTNGSNSEKAMDPAGMPMLAAALKDTVSRHLVADVDVGFFLSSGRDSSTLLALASELGHPGLRTVTLGFDEFKGSEQDETVLAQQLADQLQCKHSSIYLSRSEIASMMDRFLESMDQPTIDGLNTFLVSSAAAASGLKVSISGIGGDELFAGYSTFQDVPRLVGALARVPGAHTFGRMFTVVADPVLRHFTSPKYAGILQYGVDYEGAYLLRRGLFMPWELPRILDPDLVREGLKELSPIARLDSAQTSSLHKIVEMETSLYLRNQLLRDTDWASMAHSLEVRTPFVDAQLFSDVVKISSQYGWPRKEQVAQTPKTPLPAGILSKPKTGFSLPFFDPRKNGGTRDERSPQRHWASEVYHTYRYNVGQRIFNV